jgi:hypothetical protein
MIDYVLQLLFVLPCPHSMKKATKQPKQLLSFAMKKQCNGKPYNSLTTQLKLNIFMNLNPH